MKLKFVIAFALLCVAFISCENIQPEYETVNLATPEYMTLQAFRTSTQITSPATIIESGKIYAYNNLVLVNDVDKGIHIIDNSNPENPTQIAFIKIIGNIDMEVKENYLYADSLMDLLVFDLSDINNIHQVARLKNVFNSYIPMPLIENVVYNYNGQSYGTDMVQIGWTITQEERLVGERNIDGGIFGSTDVLTSNVAESTGQGGSLARFKIVGDYLYAVDSHSFNIFNINNLESPQELDDVHAGFDIETIFYKDNLLFLGSIAGMYIYDITSPETPQFISEFQHGTACDPVVVDDTYAYITLRGGNNCGALESQLLIVDITNIYNPELKEEYAMDNPYGLGIKDDLIFICDGTSGLKVYNKTAIENLELLNTFENINAYDVIPMTNNLLMIGDNILYQYNYSDEGLDLLSEFPLN